MIRCKSLAGFVIWAALGLLPLPAMAFDCTKATSTVDRAICAAPALIEQDAALGKAYAYRLAADPARAATLRTEQRAWLAQRDKLCGIKGAPQPKTIACLTGLYRARLGVLAAGSSVPASAPHVLPAAAVLAGPPPPTLPDLPTKRPDADASLSRSAVPAAGPSDALLDVRMPGRFTIEAKSGSGVALQIVDMIAGPGDVTGEPGVKDGRIDALLDRGTYKIRITGAAGAKGDAQLSVRPFHEAADIANALVFGGEADATLSDGAQRSFWISVQKGGHVSVTAVGRALGDLRLWRNGSALSELTPALDRITPKSGHPLTRARIEGDVEPGLYFATAYGGPKLAWADGDPAEPFHIRAGDPEPLPGGWVDGVIGPIGFARFGAPDEASTVRLELPEPAAATLSLRKGDDVTSEKIAKTSREPVTRLDSPAGTGRVIEVEGQEGQPFRLRTLAASASRRIDGVGPHWIGVNVAGEGGDEVPATVVLAQFQGAKGGRVIASNAPQVGPGKAWRQKLNFRGRSTLLFEVTSTMETAVTVTGLRVNLSIAPLLGNAAPRNDGKTPRWTLEPGWYVLTLSPLNDSFGIVDVTLGPPGMTGEAQVQPPRPSISLGIQTLERDADIQILTNETPTLLAAPFARALPADLEASAFTLYQEAGQALDVPVRTPAHGFLAVTAVNGVPVAVQRGRATAVKNGQTVTLHIPAPERPRGVVLSWSEPVPAATIRVPDQSEAETVVAGKAHFFDLGRDQSKSFALDVAQGGLYRVETVGRLHTSIAVATDFVPKLDSASANGAGENALSQSFLRAGRYAVTVKASDSSGRVGLVARPAALPVSEALTDGTSARASLADGRGVVFPVDITEAGRYRLDLYALNTPLRARLEDQEGWPLTVPGPTTAIERRFEPGHYRLVVLPEPVDARAVARLSRILPTPPLSGHGPHPLPFDQTTAFQWREPASAGEMRAPDRWTFTLQGPAKVSIDLSSGMIGTLTRAGDEANLGRIVAKSGFSGRLEPGSYVVDALSLGRNDRLDYSVTLKSDEIQPGVARSIELPVTIPFALAGDRVVSLTSFGRTDLRGILKDAQGRVVERLDDRVDDWNIALSRSLPAGAYTLDLSAADPRPPAKDDAADTGDDSDSSDPADADTAASVDTPAEDAPQAAAPAEPDQPATAEMHGDQAASGDDDSDGDSSEAPDDPDQPPEKAAATDTPTDEPGDKTATDKPEADKAETEVTDTSIEIRLALPETVKHPALTDDGAAVASGPGVHQFLLPAVPAGRLMMAAARSGQELVLSLERVDASGHWAVAGFERSKIPLVATPSDGDTGRPWRVSVWAVDGGPAEIQVAIRSAERTAAGVGTVMLDPVPFGDIAPDVRVALVGAPASVLLALQSRPDGLLEGSVAGRTLQPVTDTTLVPQADATWIVSRASGSTSLDLKPVAAPAGGLSLTIPAEGRASFPKADAASGTLAVWRADSTFGQPALSAGNGFGVAPGSAVALAGDDAIRIWNASGSDPLPVRVAATSVSQRPELRADSDLPVTLAKATAQPVTLPPGRKRLTLDLGPGTAAILGPDDQHATTIWAGDQAQSRTIDGDWAKVLFVNLSGEARAARVLVAPLPSDPIQLAAGTVTKRFFGAAGSLSMRVAGRAGDKLVAAGADATFIADDGHVDRGASIALTGSGEVILDHPPGLVAAWVERPGLSPWRDAKPQAVALPAIVPLQGDAMALTLTAPSALLLHVRSSAPVILTLDPHGEAGVPTLFPAGAEFHRLLVAGDATLRLYSPHDGPLGGSLELTASPVTPASEGIGEPVALAPGASALFGFDVAKRSAIGVGIRAEPDLIAARLLDSGGRSLGSGVAQLQSLDPGHYVLEASVPVNGRTTIVRPAIVGLVPPPSGPPPNIVRDYMQLVGLAPTAPNR